MIVVEEESEKLRETRETREKATTVEFTDDYIVQEAEKAPTTVEQIRKAMESLGDTSFEAASVEVEADENIFIPVGVLKNARRKAADLLLEKILSGDKKEQKHPDLADFSYLCNSESRGSEASDQDEQSPALSGTLSETLSGIRGRNPASKRLLLSVEVNESSSLFEAAFAGADIIYIPVSRFEELAAPENAEKLEDLKAERIELVFRVPLINHDHELDKLKPLLEKVKAAGFGIACSEFGAVQLAKELSIPFVAGKEFNNFNAFTASTLYQAGAYRVTLSSELNLSEIKNICEALQTCKGSGQTEIFVYGRELMLITENDLLKPLVDRRIVRKDSEVLLVDQEGSEFPVERLGTRTLIYDSKVLDMLKYAKNLKDYGVDVLRLDLSFNTQAEIKEIIKAYKEALAGKETRLKSARGIEYTTGHYFKGI